MNRWLLESNGNPAAPSQGLLSAEFDAHLVEFATLLRDVSLYPNSKTAHTLIGQRQHNGDISSSSSLERLVVLERAKIV